MLSQITKTSLRRIGSTDPLHRRDVLLALSKNVAWSVWQSVNHGRLPIAQLEEIFEKWWKSIEEMR